MRKSLGTLLILAACAVAEHAKAQESIPIFTESMRERRLDQLLGAYCKNQLDQPNLSEGARSYFSIEQANLFLNASTTTNDKQQRTKLWASASQTLGVAIQSATDPVIKMQLRLQLATLDYAIGKWLMEFAELQAHESTYLKECRDRLTQAIDSLNLMNAEVNATSKPDRNKKKQAAEKLRRDSLMQFSSSIQTRLAFCQLLLAKITTNADQKRVLLEGAVEQLEGLIRSNAEEATTVEAGMDIIEAYRSLGRLDQARRHIDRLEQDGSPQFQDAVIAERVELLLEEHKAHEALKIIEPKIRSRTKSPARWEFLKLRILLELADAMRSEPKDAAKLRTGALAQLRKLETLGEPIWTRKGELLVGKHSGGLIGSEESDVRKTADILFRSRDFTKATEMYRQAARKAEENNNIDDVFNLSLQAARSMELSNQYEAAADTLESVSLKVPTNPAAAAAMLASLQNRYRVLKATGDIKQAEKLADLAARHRKLFPKDETSGEVLIMFAAVRYSQGRYREATDLYRSIPETDPLFFRGQFDASRCYERWLAPLSDAATAAASDLEAAISFHESLLRKIDLSTAPAPVERQELLLRLAKLYIDPRINRVPDGIRLLKEALSDSRTPHRLVGAARRFLVAAHAIMSQFQLAEEIADQLAESSEEDILATVSLLHQVTWDASDIKKQFAGQVQNKLLQNLKNVPEAERSSEEILARAWTDIDLGIPERVQSARESLAALRTKLPKDARIVEALASCDMRAHRYDEAAKILNELAAGLKVGSGPWFRAKLLLVNCTRRSGSATEATRMIDVLQTLYPELGGPIYKAAFDRERQAAKPD